MLSKQRERSLIFESVVETIKGDLLRGELKAGDRLPTIAEYSEQFKVGQASVREAYRILENMGILEITQGRGTYVSSTIISIRDVLRRFQFAEKPSRVHLLEARKLLEPGVAALAALRATAVEADAILEAVEKEEQLRPKAAEWVELNIGFHGLIVSGAHNPVLAQMLTAIHSLIRDSEPQAAQLPIVREKGKHFHKLIALAIKEGNPEAARALMYQHIESVEHELGRLTETEGASAFK